MIKTDDLKDKKKSENPIRFTKTDCKYLKITLLRIRTKSSQELSSDFAQTSGSQDIFNHEKSTCERKPSSLNGKKEILSKTRT